jgi:hypothetical protein
MGGAGSTFGEGKERIGYRRAAPEVGGNRTRVVAVRPDLKDLTTPGSATRTFYQPWLENETCTSQSRMHKASASTSEQDQHSGRGVLLVAFTLAAVDDNYGMMFVRAAANANCNVCTSSSKCHL